MAGEVKFGKEAAEKVIDLLKQAKSGDQLEAVANKTGFDVEALDDVVKKGVGKGGAKGGKDLLQSVVEKLGGTIESVQTEVNTLLGRTRDVSGGRVPPSAKGAVELTGPADTTKGKGFTLKPKTLALPPGKETTPPKVSPEFAKETTTPTGFTLKTEVPTDKALVPVKQPEFVESEVIEGVSPRMSKLADTAQQGLVPSSGPFNKRMFTDAEIAEMAGKAKPGRAGKGVEEINKSQTPTQQAMEAALAPKPPQMSTVKRAAAGLGALALGAGFSKEANAPTTIQAAQIDKVQDIKTLVDNADKQGVVTPEQKVVFQQQAEQVDKASESLEKMLLKEYQRDKARVELMQLIETVANGLVTAIGANALLNRGSPYAVDFSKGPKTDWAGQFDRLQKDFNTQMNALNEKYKLEAQEKREAEREARRKYEFEETQKLNREKLEAQKAKEAEAAALKTEEKEQKAQSDIRASIAVIQDETAAPGRILTEKKNLIRLGNTKLGESAIQELLTQATNSVEGGRSLARRGKLLVKDFFNMDIGLNVEEQQAVTKKFAELLEQKLDKQGRPAAPAPAAAPVDDDRALLEELRARKAAQQKGG